MAQGQLGSGEALRIAGGLQAVGAHALALQAGVAQAGPQAPLRVERDGVVQMPLGAALVVLGVGVVGRWVAGHLHAAADLARLLDQM